MVKVGNQGLDDRYIRLRSHRISHPVVSGLRQSHSITFANVRLDILKFSSHHSSTKFPFNRVSKQNWYLSHDHARLMYRSNRSFNMPPPGNHPGIWLFWKLLFKFPPTRAKMPFKCPTLGSIQVIKCPHPGDISQAQKRQKNGEKAFSCRTKSL